MEDEAIRILLILILLGCVFCAGVVVGRCSSRRRREFEPSPDHPVIDVTPVDEDTESR
jgi:hypothetical protein